MKLAAEVIMGKKIPERLMDLPYGNYVCIKAPMFSFMRLDKADPILGVEMASTGEVACIGEDFSDALIKSLEATELNIPIYGGNVLISVGGEELKRQVLPLAIKLKNMGFTSATNLLSNRYGFGLSDIPKHNQKFLSAITKNEIACTH